MSRRVNYDDSWDSVKWEFFLFAICRKYCRQELFLLSLTHFHSLLCLFFSVVLVSHSDGKPCIDIIMGHSVQSIQICSQASGSSLQWSLGENLLKCLEDSDESAVSVEELSARKQRLKVWLSKNLITVTEEGNLLKLDDVLVIHPPYGVKQCTSSNQIILGKVQTLVQKLYSQSPS